MSPRAHPKIFFQRDLRHKGITWTRQHTNRKVRAKEFPPPDGKTSDAPSAPNFWFEHTIDKYLRQRAAAMREQAAAISEHAATMRQRAAAMRETRRAASSLKSDRKQPTRAPSPVREGKCLG
jgi:hypothetical protein